MGWASTPKTGISFSAARQQGWGGRLRDAVPQHCCSFCGSEQLGSLREFVCVAVDTPHSYTHMYAVGGGGPAAGRRGAGWQGQLVRLHTRGSVEGLESLSHKTSALEKRAPGAMSNGLGFYGAGCGICLVHPKTYALAGRHGKRGQPCWCMCMLPHLPFCQRACKLHLNYVAALELRGGMWLCDLLRCSSHLAVPAAFVSKKGIWEARAAFGGNLSLGDPIITALRAGAWADGRNGRW